MFRFFSKSKTKQNHLSGVQEQPSNLLFWERVGHQHILLLEELTLKITLSFSYWQSNSGTSFPLRQTHRAWESQWGLCTPMGTPKPSESMRRGAAAHRVHRPPCLLQRQNYREGLGNPFPRMINIQPSSKAGGYLLTLLPKDAVFLILNGHRGIKEDEGGKIHQTNKFLSFCA